MSSSRAKGLNRNFCTFFFWLSNKNGKISGFRRDEVEAFILLGCYPAVFRCSSLTAYTSVSQPPGRGPVPGSVINYTGPRDIPLELITNLNVILYLSTCHTVHIIVLLLFMIML